VRVYRGLQQLTEVERALTDKIDASGRFSVVLSSPLIESLQLKATACAEGGKPCAESTAEVAVDPGDWGYEAFEIARDKDHPELRERPWRTVVEGRLKIPETPLQIGFRRQSRRRP
jgi:hypothetical protein